MRIVNNGPLGNYRRQEYRKIPVYTPEGVPGKNARGLVVLVSGGYTNHTSLADLPSYLARGGWNVKIPVFPEFENTDDTRLVEGGRKRSRELKDSWQTGMKAAVFSVVERELQMNPATAIYLGGLSLGGAASLIALEDMSLPAKAQIKGLLLMVPALNYTSLEKNRFLKPILRRVGLPLKVMMKKRRQRTPPPFDPSLAGHIQVMTDRPASADYAAVLFSEAAKTSLKRLKEYQNLPPVLVIHAGKSDETVDVSSVDLVRRTFPQISVQEIPGSSHWILPQSNRHQAFEAIRHFLSQAN